jgi:hypothetical protein
VPQNATRAPSITCVSCITSSSRSENDGTEADRPLIRRTGRETQDTQAWYSVRSFFDRSVVIGRDREVGGGVGFEPTAGCPTSVFKFGEVTAHSVLRVHAARAMPLTLANGFICPRVCGAAVVRSVVTAG